MNCLLHTDKEAVRYCIECGAPMCRECSDIYGGYCRDCSKERIISLRKQLINALIPVIVGAIIGLVLAVQMLFTEPFDNRLQMVGMFIMMIVCTAGVYYGWGALSSLTSSIFLFLPIIGWVIYVFVKLVLAYFIGWAIMLYKVIPIIVDIVKLNKALKILDE